MTSWLWCFGVTGAIALFSLVAPAPGQEPYYKDKTIRILVGTSAGGTFDTYSRTIARHIAKHIPGDPRLIVENVPGAGGIIAANRLYKVVKPDGLTIGHFSGGLARSQVLGIPGIEFDALKFNWLAVPARVNAVCVFTRRSGIASVEEWINSPKPVRFGSTGPGSDLYDTPKVLEAALGLPIQLLAGYKGASEIRLAAEAGELEAVCWPDFTTRILWSKALETGDVKIVLQATPRPAAGLDKIPLAVDLAKSQEARRLIEIGIHDAGALLFAYSMPPGTPKEPVQIMRQALMTTFKDPEFLADTKKSMLAIDPVSGEEMDKIIAGLFKLEPALVSRLKTILVPAK
jgi:tripartite-type tricarboxylate transporter receptor subunit TctC